MSNRNRRRQQPHKPTAIERAEAFLKDVLHDRCGLFVKDGEFVIADRHGPQAFGTTLSELIHQWHDNQMHEAVAEAVAESIIR